jgi:hypothetical protein
MGMSTFVKSVQLLIDANHLEESGMLKLGMLPMETYHGQGF